VTQPALIAPGRRVTPSGYRVLPAEAAEADEADWLRARRRGVGSSDVAAILGVAERRTALHVWYDKRDRLPDDDAGEAALWGRLHEDTVAREWARRNRSTVRRVGLVAHVEHPWRLCTLDRQIGICPLHRDAGSICALEVKTRNAWVAGKWRRSVPDDVLAQVVWEMAVTGYEHIHVACLIGGNDYRQYIIRRDGELEADIVAGVEAFWTTSILGGARPAVDTLAYADDLVSLDNRLHPDRGGAVVLAVTSRPWELVDEYEETRLAVKAATARHKAAKVALIEALDGREMALVDEGRGDLPMWTYLERRQAPGVNLAVMAEMYPAAYGACVSERTGRAVDIARDLRHSEERT
jgi:putative phage-type endonuclease